MNQGPEGADAADTHQWAVEAAQYVEKLLPAELQRPSWGVICGSGLGGLVDTVLPQPRQEFHYTDIPHFPSSSVPGHAGKLLFGLLGPNGFPVVFMIGRVHHYEGYSIQRVTFPVRVLKLIGVEGLIVTNASGALSPEYAVGDVVVLGDHLNIAGLAGNHPLKGPNLSHFGERFPALSDAYDLELRRCSHQLWKQMHLTKENRRLHEGVYAFVGGPSYETRAECRMLRLLGADLVGMSTVPEIIVARHCKMRVLALSLVTNKVVSDMGMRGDDSRIQNSSQELLNLSIKQGKANHAEVLMAGQEAAKDLQELIHRILLAQIHSAQQSKAVT